MYRLIWIFAGHPCPKVCFLLFHSSNSHATFQNYMNFVNPKYLDRQDYCPFDISRKDVFCLAFHLKWKYFVLIDYIVSETICLFCFCVLFSNMYPKIKFIAKTWSDLCNLVKWFFGIFVLVNIFYFSLLNLNYWCFTTILWKFQKNWTSETHWKSASKLPTLQISA